MLQLEELFDEGTTLMFCCNMNNGTTHLVENNDEIIKPLDKHLSCYDKNSLRREACAESPRGQLPKVLFTCLRIYGIGT